MTLNRPRSRSQNFHIKYLECCERYNVGHNGGQIGNHQWASDVPNFCHSGALALRTERQSARMTKIKNVKIDVRVNSTYVK